MNSSIVTADRGTHLKIAAVALIAGICVIWIGVTARMKAADTRSAPRFEHSAVMQLPSR